MNFKRVFCYFGHDDQLVGPGKFLDVNTYAGNFRILLFCCAATYFMWNLREILLWLHKLMGDDNQYVDIDLQPKARFFAVVIFVVMTAKAIFSIITLTINRLRQSKAVKGEHIDAQESRPEDSRVPMPEILPDSIFQELNEPRFEEHSEADEPQNPIGIRPSAEATPPSQISDVRIKPEDGHITLVVPKKHS